MDKTLLLPEHRCLCGKLLFRGVLFLSQVQLKCRNCGTVRIIGQRYEELGENQYAFLAALPSEDIYSDDPSPYVVDVTDSACKMLGFNREELVGREVRSLDPLMAEGAYGNLWKLIVARHFQPLSLEVYQPKKDGSFVKVRSRTIFQKAQEAMYLLTIFDLIKTVKVLPSPQLPPQEPNIENMFSPLLIEIDRNLICDTVSYEFASLLGYLIVDIVNKPFLYLYPPPLRRKRKELIISMKKSRQSFRIMKDVLIGKENTKHLFESAFTVRYTDNGIFNGFLISSWPAEITTALDKR